MCTKENWTHGTNKKNKRVKKTVWRRREQSGQQCVVTSVNPQLQMERTCECVELECENSLINDGNCGVKFQLGRVGRRLSHHNTSPSSQNTVFPFECVHAWVRLFLWPTLPPPTPPPDWIPFPVWWLIYEDLHIYNGKHSMQGRRGAYIERYECKK